MNDSPLKKRNSKTELRVHAVEVRSRQPKRKKGFKKKNTC